MDPYRRPQARVRCKCGKEKIVSCWTLHKGLSTSCGCYAKEKRRSMAKRHFWKGQMLSVSEIARAEGVSDSTARGKVKVHGLLERPKAKVK